MFVTIYLIFTVFLSYNHQYENTCCCIVYKVLSHAQGQLLQGTHIAMDFKTMNVKIKKIIIVIYKVLTL